ncbi:ArsR/SmtB family transcription factor [Aliirhizobium smilacinae]|uniref:Helix-turn-helix transcriptional regulator n=1 Tax=Aliirhizobium smilacinae TaxID=1395944 RepID=A0A5C4XP94_9HYPH|nr:metalloregulator ArsR/SmtB family transcription factor [Rhizobium smilacinae]TNM65252.1 helix-turn-helix transcriptional regulator [Rhizobium smilacinae]
MARDFKFDADQAAALLGLLANAHRLEVLGRITRQEWSVSALAEEVNLSQSALSQHLSKFRQADVVEIRRDAQTIYYSCSADAILKVLATLDEISHKNSSEAKTVA